MAETTLIQHKRSLRSKAFDTASLAIMLTAMLIIVSVVWAMSASHFIDSAMLIGFILGVVFAGALLYSTVLNFRTGGHFRCMVTTQRIVCECPLKSEGESFDIKIQEIEFIEEHASAGTDSDSTCYLRTLKGEMFWLTRSYGNPTAKILDRLEKLNPKIKSKCIS